MKRQYLIFQIVLSIILIFSTIIFSAKAAINFKPLYYYDIINLNIEKASGLGASVIKLNYDYLIDYLHKNNARSFCLPTLASTENAKTHFFEVYNLIHHLSVTLYILLPILAAGIIFTFKKKAFLYLKICGSALMLLPFIILPLLLINFDNLFTLFHKLIFHNNYWLFNPKTDPVILILPETFFMHCLIFIIVLSFIFGIILLRLYKIALRCSDEYIKSIKVHRRLM